MKRKFRKLKDIGVVVAIFTSSRIWSSPKVTAGSYSLVVLRLARHSMMALAKVIPMVSDIRPRLPPASLDDIRDRDTQLSDRKSVVSGQSVSVSVDIGGRRIIKNKKIKEKKITSY